ncbi:MAG: TetR/AcrR family transcriptional regulator, partial [Myxococcota bacterium]
MADDSRDIQPSELASGPGRRAVGRPRRTPDETDAFRLRIIEAARELFVEQGFEAVSMRKVAARAGCGPMTIYQGFENKRALLRHIWGDIFEVVLRRCTEAVDEAEDPPAGLRALASCFIDYWLEQPDHYRVIYLNEDAVAEEKDSSFVESSRIVERFSLVQDLICRAMAEGHIRAGD